jgi:peptidoglycan/xylan/chitin deacetylase (PgdA/CDA1 family)
VTASARGLSGWGEPAVRALSRLLPANVLCYVDTDASAFALTFDDGPHPATTPPLLDVLARHDARATFFLIGTRVVGNEPIVARIAAEGHELANHLMHDERSVFLPDSRFRGQLVEVNALLTPYAAVRWFRPGSGWFTPRMLRHARAHHLHAVLGTVVSMHTGGSRAGGSRAGCSARSGRGRSLCCMRAPQAGAGWWRQPITSWASWPAPACARSPFRSWSRCAGSRGDTVSAGRSRRSGPQTLTCPHGSVVAWSR